MSKIIEQYETLVRRGMPAHLGLDPEPICGGVWYSDAEGGVGLEDRDACDLITMHAMRWFRGSLSRGWDGDFMATSFKGTAKRGGSFLAVILEATKHLEPANA